MEKSTTFFCVLHFLILCCRMGVIFFTVGGFMERHLSYSAAAVSAIVLSAAFPSFAAPDPGQAGEETEAFSETQAAYQQGTRLPSKY